MFRYDLETHDSKYDYSGGLYIFHIYYDSNDDIRLSIDNNLNDILFWSKYTEVQKDKYIKLKKRIRMCIK